MENIMRLIIVRGLPGSGKSTFAKSLNIFHVEIDMFCMIDSKYQWDATKGRQRSELCFSAARNALQAGIDVVVSNTFARKRDIEPYARLAREFNANFVVYLTTGGHRSIHPVPDETITRLRESWEDFPLEILLKS